MVEFYEKIKKNKAIVVPDEEQMEMASRLRNPVFSIIEDPLVKKRRKK